MSAEHSARREQSQTVRDGKFVCVPVERIALGKAGWPKAGKA